MKITNVTHYYEQSKTPAIENINAIIESKEFVSIIGHTGSGKSTLIQTLNGLIIPTSGQIEVDEFVIKNKAKIKNIKELRKTVGIVFQFSEYQLFEETIKKDIAFGPKNFNLEFDDEKICKLLELVGLDKSYMDKSPFEISGGEKRKVAIAGILAFDPDILILDEPTAGLDPVSTINMMELLTKLNKQGKTIIIVTHQMDHVLKYSNHVIAISHGHKVYDGKPIDLFYDKKVFDTLNLNEPEIVHLVNKLSLKYPLLKDKKIKDIDEFVKAYKEIIR